MKNFPLFSESITLEGLVDQNPTQGMIALEAVIYFLKHNVKKQLPIVFV